MSDPAPPRRANWRLSSSLILARPRLAAGAVVGLAAGVVAALGFHLRLSAAAIAGWDVFCAVFLVLALGMIAAGGPDQIRARAEQQDEGQGLLLLLVLTACAASLGAAGIELSIAKGEHGAGRILHVAVALLTVAGSWLVMQVILALHYAHEYYARDPASGGDAGGLDFPGGGEPDYWDFLYFSTVIGVAAQTADIAFTRRALRRLGALHGLLAFVFNTLILALTINLAAGLF